MSGSDICSFRVLKRGSSLQLWACAHLHAAIDLTRTNRLKTRWTHIQKHTNTCGSAHFVMLYVHEGKEDFTLRAEAADSVWIWWCVDAHIQESDVFGLIEVIQTFVCEDVSTCQMWRCQWMSPHLELFCSRTFWVTLAWPGWETVRHGFREWTHSSTVSSQHCILMLVVPHCREVLWQRGCTSMLTPFCRRCMSWTP